MVEYNSVSRKLFIVGNYVVLAVLGLLCILPIINVLAVSFSDAYYVSANMVKLWPKGFTLTSYKFVAQTPEFLRSLLVALERLVLGSGLNMLLTIIVAYPLSKEVRQFRFRTVYVWLYVFTMLFAGGLVPSYMIVRNLHLLDSIWSL